MIDKKDDGKGLYKSGGREGGKNPVCLWGGFAPPIKKGG
jgi:hypothetical protein